MDELDETNNVTSRSQYSFFVDLTFVPQYQTTFDMGKPSTALRRGGSDIKLEMRDFANAEGKMGIATPVLPARINLR